MALLKLTFILQRYAIAQNILNLIGSLFFYSIKKIIRFNKSKGESIVIISFHKLGDTVFTIPAVQKIQLQFNKVYIMCFSESEIIYKEILNEANYLTFKKEQFFLNERIASSAIRKSLKNLKPKIIFDLTSSIKSASLLFTSNANFIVGSNDSHFKQIYTHYKTIRERPHLSEIYLDAISPLIPTGTREIGIKTNIPFDNKGLILIHPSAGWSAKIWSLKKYIELANILKNKNKIGFVIQKGDMESDVKEEIISNSIQIYETENLHDLINLIRYCSFFIGNDSGPLNIASLLFGKPTFTIFGPTNPEFHVAAGKHNNYIINMLKCSPEAHQKYCFTFGGINGCPSFECMQTLETKSVADSILTSIAKLELEEVIYKNQINFNN